MRSSSRSRLPLSGRGPSLPWSWLAIRAVVIPDSSSLHRAANSSFAAVLGVVVAVAVAVAVVVAVAVTVADVAVAVAAVAVAAFAAFAATAVVVVAVVADVAVVAAFVAAVATAGVVVAVVASFTFDDEDDEEDDGDDPPAALHGEVGFAVAAATASFDVSALFGASAPFLVVEGFLRGGIICCKQD